MRSQLIGAVIFFSYFIEHNKSYLFSYYFNEKANFSINSGDIREANSNWGSAMLDVNTIVLGSSFISTPSTESLSGKISELIIYPSNQLNNHSAIVSEINSYSQVY